MGLRGQGSCWTKLLLLLALMKVAANAHAANSTWQGDSSDRWNSDENWTAGVPGTSDTAIFSTVAAGASTTPIVDFNQQFTQIGTISFSNNAPVYSIQVSAGSLNDPIPFFSFEVTGFGIVNSSANVQSLHNNGGVGGANSTGAVTTFSGSALISAGAGFMITNHQSALGEAGTLQMEDTSFLGNATLFNEGGGHFGGGNAGQGGFTFFRDSASAGTASITNGGGFDSGRTSFTENSTANGANIINQGGDDDQESGGVTNFSDSASLGNATITNQNGSNVGFGGRTAFSGGTAGNGTIVNQGAVFDNIGFGATLFAGNSTAGNASITTNGGVGGAGATTTFEGDSTAGSALLTTNGGSFGGAGGLTKLIENASGGNATVVTNSGGTFDISGLATTGTTAGSIAGAGSYVLGAKRLTTGGNNASTTVSGPISGIGGSLTKNGTGTLTLSGPNTFTSGVILNSGRLNVDNTSALGSGLLLITGGTLGTTVSALNIANAVNIFGNVTVAPVDAMAGQLSFTGAVNLGGVTHTISSDSAGQTVFSTAITGAGTAGVNLQAIGAGTARFAFLGTSSNTYAGTTTVGGGTTTLSLNKSSGATAIAGDLTVNSGGTVTLEQANQIADTAAVSLVGSGNLALNGFHETIGSLNGTGNVTLQGGGVAGRLETGSGGFTGVISSGGLNTGGLTKTGPGTLILAGASTYAGSTEISGGHLIANNAAGSATGASNVDVQAGGTLGGGNSTSTTGFIGGRVRVLDNGRVTPGAISLAGKLTINNDFSLQNLSLLEFQLRQANAFNSTMNDLLTISGNVVLDGILNIDDTLGFGGAGDYLLMSYRGMLTNNILEIGAVPFGFNAGQFSVDVSTPGEVLLRVVPEPSDFLLVLFGIVTFALVLHRRSGHLPAE